MFHVKFGHNMHHSEDKAIKNSIIFDLTFKGHPSSKVMRSTDMPYMTYYMCFIYILVMTSTIQEIQPIKNQLS